MKSLLEKLVFFAGSDNNFVFVLFVFQLRLQNLLVSRFSIFHIYFSLPDRKKFFTFTGYDDLNFLNLPRQD